MAIEIPERGDFQWQASKVHKDSKVQWIFNGIKANKVQFQVCVYVE